jgi:hypothetical protein
MSTTLDPSKKGGKITLSNGNTTIAWNSGGAGSFGTVLSVDAVATNNKIYWESNRTITDSSSDFSVGIANSTISLTDWLGDNANGYGYFPDTGVVYRNGALVTTYASAAVGTRNCYCYEQSTNKFWATGTTPPSARRTRPQARAASYSRV